jgi:sarcosine oxidase subunit beta
MAPDLPLIVDDATGWYVLGEAGGLALLGGTDRDGTVSLETREEPDTLDRIFSTSVTRAPELENSGLVNTIVGLRSMSPDDRALIGPLPQVQGLYCACAFSGHGFMHAPATARGLAELITTGRSETIDLSAFDPRRFSDSAGHELQRETYVF